MFIRAFILLGFIAALVRSEPIPVDVEERQLGSIIDGVTSAVGGGINTFLSGAASVIGEVTAFPGEIVSVVTSAGGEAVTVVTQVGGAAYTLATGEGGKVTSFGGHVWTVATAEGQAGFTAVTGAAGSAISNALTHTSNSGSTLPNWALSMPLSMSMLAVLAGIFVGARIAI